MPRPREKREPIANRDADLQRLGQSSRRRAPVEADVGILRLNGPLLKRRLTEQFNGMQEALARKLEVSPSTISRWLMGASLPKNGELLLRLSRALDVDPMLVLDLRDQRSLNGLVSVGLRQSRMRGKAFGMLEVLRPLFWPVDDWPPAQWGYRWESFDFHNAGGAAVSHFAHIRIRPRREWIVLHWGFRDEGWHGKALGPWWAYGSILLGEEDAQLLNYNGLRDTCAWRLGEEFCARTWFGPGAAQFRIASIHGFEASMRDMGEGELPYVTFAFREGSV